MRNVIFLLLWVVSVVGNSQDRFELKKIRFKNLAFSVTKDEVIKTNGQPRIVNTNYECGFYANDLPGGPYYQLAYDGFNYIGSDKEKFILENVEFDPKGIVKVNYGSKIWTGLLTKEEFAETLGVDARKLFRENPDQEVYVIFSANGDDGARFRFKYGRLIKFEYLSPC